VMSEGPYLCASGKGSPPAASAVLGDRVPDRRWADRRSRRWRPVQPRRWLMRSAPVTCRVVVCVVSN